MNKIAIIVGAVGVVVVIVSAVLGFRVIPDIIKRKIEEQTTLRPMSETWESWSDITKPVYMNVYILNVTNKDTISTDGYPKFVQVGPYAYRQKRRKVNLTLSDGERLVSYEQETFYFFEKSASGRRLNENNQINILNLPFYMVLAGVGRAMPGAEPLVGNLLLRTEGIIRTTTVGELMFKGMNVKNINDVLGGIGIPVPDAFVGDLFGLYRGNNGSTDGRFTIHTGVGDSSVFGNIMTWNGKSDLGYWAHLSECDKIKGGDGSLFPPFVEKSREVEIFSTDICRSISLTYNAEQEVKGIKGYKFTLPKKVLEDAIAVPENRCYCLKDDVNMCLGAGVIDVSTCKAGAPFVMSTPYFLDGNETYSQNSGLWPNRDLHETSMIIEPNSGALLKANKRLQLNMDYKYIPNVFAMNGTHDMIFPILWVEETAEFTDKNVEDLKEKLLKPKKALVIWRWVAIGIGIFLTLAGIAIYVWKG